MRYAKAFLCICCKVTLSGTILSAIKVMIIASQSSWFMVITGFAWDGTNVLFINSNIMLGHRSSSSKAILDNASALAFCSLGI